jgi:hypothetical protein
MNTKRLENPCRQGSIARRIVNVLMNSRKRTLALTEIAFQAKVATPQVEQVVSALRNPYHNACIARTGLTIHRSINGEVFLALSKPNPSARRPQPKRVGNLEAVSE